MTHEECKTYYYEKFPDQFREWLKHTNAHEHHGEGVYIPIQNLRSDVLQYIPPEEQSLFRCALACTVLCDQLMYTHFKRDYPAFQAVTLYPKMEYGISNINVKPWDIVDGVNLQMFREFVDFFVADMKSFFESSTYVEAVWQNVRNAMLADTDVAQGTYGNRFVKELQLLEEIKTADV